MQRCKLITFISIFYHFRRKSNDGPSGTGEFYFEDIYAQEPPALYGDNAAHFETSTGGTAILKGANNVVSTSIDPFAFNSEGLRWHNTTNGTSPRSEAFEIVRITTSPGTFGKAIGLGEPVLLCDAPPLEVGNRVWNDTDKDGVQDPNEKILSGVNVSLYKGATKIAQTSTNTNGEYYFSSKSKLGAGWTATGADTTLLPNTAYKLVFGEGQVSGTTLTVAGLGQFTLTVKDATANNGNDQNDSDLEIVNGAFCINLTTGSAGSVNHSFDAGFYCTNPPIGNKITQTAPTCSGTTPQNNGKISLTAAITPYDKYRVKTGTSAWSGDTTYATATTVGSTFPKDLVTTAPNAGATYVVRFYTGECCFKDTTITVAAVTCATPCTVVTGASIALNPSSPVVAGTTVNLTASKTDAGTPTTYTWASSGGSFTSTNQNATLTSPTAGTYNFTVTIQNNNGTGICTAMATSSLSVSTAPTPCTVVSGASIALNPSSPVVAGTTVNLTASKTDTGSPTTYTWASSGGSFTSTNQNATLTSPTAGTYNFTVTIQNNNGTGICTATATSSLSVSTAPIP